MKQVTYHGLTYQLPDNISIAYAHTSVEHRIKAGIYENPEIQMLEYIHKDATVLELGGSLGIVSCLANCKLSDGSKHVVVEANPQLLSILENNGNVNNCKFKIKHGVAAGVSGRELTFHYNDYPLNGNIHNQGNYGTAKNSTMKSVTPEDISSEYDLQFDTLICDIEGSEYELLLNQLDHLSKYKTLMVEFHTWGMSSLNRHQTEQLYSSKFNIRHFGESTLFTKK